VDGSSGLSSASACLKDWLLRGTGRGMAVRRGTG
jgi:hypothetical protein